MSIEGNSVNAHQLFDEMHISKTWCFIIFKGNQSKLSEEMKKGMHPQMQWISYVTQSGRLMQVMMPNIHHAGKVYHLKAKRQMAEHMSQMAKFRQRYEKQIAPRDKP
ncbi:hypothetical protein ACFX2K_007363 [Malus domestica]